MSFAKAVASAILVFAIAGGAISPAVAAKLHKGRAHPHMTTGLSSSPSSPAGAVQRGAAGATVAPGGSAAGAAMGGAAAEGGGGAMGGGNGM
jgi:hypothetical protein